MHGSYLHGYSIHISFRSAWCNSIFLLTLVTSGAAHSQESHPDSMLTEQAAIEYALAQPALGEAFNARILAAESDVIASTTRPNPVVSIAHDSADVPDGNGNETSVMLSQTFDISGKRALRKDAAETRVTSTRLDNQSRQIATVKEVRRTFAEALFRQQLREANGEWLKRIESALAVVGHLSSAGEASGYDRRRLEREVQSARARVRIVDAETSRTREMLAGLIARPISTDRQLGGELLPDALPPLETLLAVTERHPDIASLEAQAAAFERDRQAAERLKTPEITVGIGTKHVREPGFSDTSLMLALSVPIPMSDRGQAQEQQARAQTAAVQAERALRLARLQAELRGLWSEASQLRQNALSFREEPLTSSQELSRIAEASYRGGEGSLLELLDAYRAELEAHTMKLDLALRARMSRIELDALTGATQHE
jgi:cobalt-zinc-cadmium efflux system outer membrane protein